jgi:Tfp pilus assembly protein PilZ
MTDSARRDKRYPSKHALLVRCDTWAEFAQMYAADVSQGGMFIVTDEAFELLVEVDVDMRLPEGHSVLLRATVVHVVGAEQAARESRPAGVGVHFVDLNPTHKQQILQLVEFARWEGDSPTASYANRMFESSTTLPPSKVLEALSKESPTESRKPAAPASSRAAAGQSLRPSTRSSSRNKASPSGQAPQAQDDAGNGEPTGKSLDPRAKPSDGPSSPAAEAVPPKPLDAAKLKLGMTHLAHKRFDQAIKTFEEVLKETPGDRQTTQWLQVTYARQRLKHGDPDGAAEHYQKALEADETNHEARKFVREHSTKKRLNSLPFGRYFVKKS